MSTNTSNLPDVQELQRIANQLFKALPEEAPKEISLDPYKHPRAAALAQSVSGGGATLPLGFFSNGLAPQEITQPTASPVSPAGVLATPPSLAGAGISTPGVPGVNQDHFKPGFNLAGIDYTPGNSSYIQDHNDKKAFHNGQVPASVAGSGASPSYTHQQNNFDLKEPVTSFPDASIDKPTAHTDPFALSFIDEQPYWSDISAILGTLNNNILPDTLLQPSQHPIEQAGPSFYFLQHSPHPFNSLPPGAFHHTFDAYKIKKDFPILNEKVNGKNLVWLDNAATTQKPQSVIDRISYFYQHENSNIHRAAHELAARATDAYEAARKKVQQFLGAGSVNEIIFVRGATEGINLVAQSWGAQHLKSGDEIIVSNLEHHANIVPWKRLADKRGLTLKVIPVDDDGQILLDEYAKLLTSRTRLVAFTQVSNALGTITPAEQIIALAHNAGAKVLVDGAQSVSHMPVNVQALDADWFVFSGHKVFGPTGIGVVYGKEDILNETEPWQGGGNMIQDVTFEEIRYHKAPNRFEAGTGNIADAVGLGAAIDYVTQLGMTNIGAYEHALLEYATHQLKQVPGVRLIGTAANKASVLSFILKGYSNDDVGKALNQEGIAVRTGHHCAQPILRRIGVETTVRPSLAFYNTCEDVDRLVAVVSRLASSQY
jgi:cysteine desulfurase/selenocysteine lyase